MADVVGLVVGVVSLGVQLAESVQKVKCFYNAVKDAPERLADIIEEIESLSEILTEIEGGRTSVNTIVGPKLQRCVATCRKAVDQFSAYADCLERRTKRHKLRGCTKFALKSESIDGLISRLESSKSNLVLAYMLYREAVADKRAAEMQQQMESIAVGQALLLAQASSVPNLSTMARTPLRAPTSAQGKKLASLRIPLWMSQTIWEVAVSRAISGWTVSLRSRQLVSWESPVVRACLSGDVLLLKQLYDCKEASPFDEILLGDGRSYLSLLTTTVLFSFGSVPFDAVQLIVAAAGGAVTVSPFALTAMWALLGYSRFSQFDVRTVKEYHRVLLSHRDSYESDEYHNICAIPRGKSRFKEMRTFAFGGREEGNIVLFWNEIRNLSRWWYWPCDWNRGINKEERAITSLLEAMTLNGEITYLVGSRAMESANPAVHHPITPLAVLYVTDTAAGSSQNISNARALRELIKGALDHGCDLHANSANRISPLLMLLHPVQPPCHFEGCRHRPYTNIDILLHTWLDLLVSIGIELASYGHKEWCMFQQLRQMSERNRPWGWWHGADELPCYESNDDFDGIRDSYRTLLSFSYGAAKCDWTAWVNHPGDQYAGQFWRMVERDDSGLGDRVDYWQQSVPGAWVEDG